MRLGVETGIGIAHPWATGPALARSIGASGAALGPRTKPLPRSPEPFAVRPVAVSKSPV